MKGGFIENISRSAKGWEEVSGMQIGAYVRGRVGAMSITKYIYIY